MKKILKTSFLITGLITGLMVNMTFCSELYAQNSGSSDSKNSKDSEKNNKPKLKDFWRCSTPSGEYLVKLSTISTVSIHEYILNGTFRILEVNVDTFGNSLARFIFAEPFMLEEAKGKSNALGTAVSRAQELGKRVDELSGIDPEELWLKAVKTTAPPTTHMHTQDYRVGSEEEIWELYRNASKAWTTGRGGVFSITREE